MSDLISRQAVIEQTYLWSKDEFLRVTNPFDYLHKRINSLPSEQPEIIRCKDCRYYQDNNDGYPHINCKWDANETPDADDFCSGAERRTDE